MCERELSIGINNEPHKVKANCRLSDQQLPIVSALLCFPKVVTEFW